MFRSYKIFLFSFVFIIFLSFDNILLEISDYKNFYKMPILHDGRIKSFGIFAEHNFNKIKYENYNSIELMANLIFNPNDFYEKKIFFIKNKEININLGLPLSDKFNLLELLYSFKKNIDLIESLKKLDVKTLLNSQKELLDLYFSVICLINIGNSMDLILFNKNISEKFLNKIESKYTLISEFGDILDNKDQLLDENIYIAKIIPINDNEWVGVNSFFKKMNYKKTTEINILNNAYNYYNNIDLKNWNIECGNFNTIIKQKISSKINFLIQIEIIYSKLKLIYKSSCCFLICVFLMLFSMKRNNFSDYFAMYFFAAGVLLIFLDILSRILITQKAPVTSLYESIIFVNFIFACCLTILNLKTKNYKKLFLFSSIFSLLLNVVTLKIGFNENNINNVMAVLNTNFWLTIHVLTISIGYSLCLICGFFSHIYLIFSLKKEINIKINQFLYNMIFSFALFALFFSFIGTLLGGIWADQAWGRFWGWDPKENGALLIVLWLTLIIHARISNIISELIFAVCAILNIVVLFLAWFGVNLLNVGLHSYGFIENMEKFLFSLIFFEFLFVCCFFIYFKIIKQT